MGIDFVWLLPIHPIGLTNRKGTLGSPYSIDNFREINREHGDLSDFRRLVSEIHRRGMRLMIDIVFRHTSHDCSWAKEHPEWYLRDETVSQLLVTSSCTNL
jgi:glycosidase